LRDDRVRAGRKDLEAHSLSSDLIESLFGRRERRMAGKLKLRSDQAVVYHNNCRTFITVYFLLLVIKGRPSSFVPEELIQTGNMKGLEKQCHLQG